MNRYYCLDCGSTRVGVEKYDYCWKNYVLKNKCFEWDHNIDCDGCRTCGIFNHSSDDSCKECSKNKYGDL